MMLFNHDTTGLLQLFQVLHPNAELAPWNNIEKLGYPETDTTLVRQTDEKIFRHPDADVALFEHSQPEVPILKALDLLIEAREMLASNERGSVDIVHHAQLGGIERP